MSKKRKSTADKQAEDTSQSAPNGSDDASKDTMSAEEATLPIEAALLTSDKPLSTAKLGEILSNVTSKTVNDAVKLLNDFYDKSKRSFRIESVAGGWQIMTLPQFSDTLVSLHKTRAQTRLSPAAMESLAIIAYRQPILRAEIEAIRGVACGEVLRSLMDRRVVKIVGRSDELGRPMLYGTTSAFLEVFGLASLKDLPKADSLKEPSYKPKIKEEESQGEEEAQQDQTDPVSEPVSDGAANDTSAKASSGASAS